MLKLPMLLRKQPATPRRPFSAGWFLAFAATAVVLLLIVRFSVFVYGNQMQKIIGSPSIGSAQHLFALLAAAAIAGCLCAVSWSRRWEAICGVAAALVFVLLGLGDTFVWVAMYATGVATFDY
jgi:hypothetical protein